MKSLANCRWMLRSSQADKHNDNRALSLPAFVCPAPPAMSARPHSGLDCATPEEVSQSAPLMDRHSLRWPELGVG